MRISRLELIRYGHFTDAALDFPEREADLHIVYGANEAGKSTARCAIGHFLFGFPNQTPLNFKHAYGDLRVGATLESSATRLSATRKKGRTKTLLDRDGNALVELESRLAQWLGGADPAFFERMFSLNHVQLRRGADAFIKEGADADTALMSAGSGLAELLAQRDALAREADALWAPSASKNRAFYQAETRVKAAEKTIRESEVTVSAWRGLKREFEAAEATHAELSAERRELQKHYRHLERLRRVAPHAMRYRELAGRITALGSVVRLEESAGAVLAEAVRADEDARIAIEQLDDSARGLEADVAAIDCDEALLSRATRVDELAERRPQIVEDAARRPELVAERRALGDELIQTAADLGWPPERLSSLPSAPALDELRALIDRFPTLEQARRHADENLGESRRRERQMGAALAERDAPLDTTALEAQLAAVDEIADIETQVKTVSAERRRLSHVIERGLARLRPPVADAGTLVDLRVPAANTVGVFERDLAHAEQALSRVSDQHAAHADEAALLRQRVEHEQADSDLPTAERVAELRAARDDRWRAIRRRYIEGDTTPDDASRDSDALVSVSETYQRAVTDADAAADRRFEHAEAVGQHAERRRTLRAREAERDQLARRKDETEQRLERLRERWRALWRPAGFSPERPADMRDWLGVRAGLIESIDARDFAAAEHARLSAELDAARAALVARLAELGVPERDGQAESLTVLTRRARDIVRDQQELRRARQAIETDLRELRVANHDKTRVLDTARAALAEWRDRWRSVLRALDLPTDTAIDAARRRIEGIERLRARSHAQQRLGDELARLDARLEAFASRLAELGSTLGHTAVNASPEQACLSLEADLRRARADRTLIDHKQADLERTRDRARHQEAARAEAARTVSRLCDAAGVESRAALQEAIRRADILRETEHALAATRTTLEQQGDGQPIDALVAACAEADLDDVADEAEQIRTQIETLEDREAAARDERNAKRRAFAAVDGDSRAAVAAAERETALADLQHAAERYASVGTAAILLKWAGQRYRLEKQQPLIRRGSEIMATLTGGSFTRIAAVFDDQDAIQIAGIRPEGGEVWPAGMSEGTRDQLYLALRVAAVEDYLASTEPLPLIADDLFINFDDERASAGLEVLAQLARRTQVIFFTHHRHLAELAASRLAGRAAVHELDTA